MSLSSGTKVAGTAQSANAGRDTGGPRLLSDLFVGNCGESEEWVLSWNMGPFCW
jgi:hypothetical protein